MVDASTVVCGSGVSVGTLVGGTVGGMDVAGIDVAGMEVLVGAGELVGMTAVGVTCVKLQANTRTVRVQTVMNRRMFIVPYVNTC